VAGGDTGHGGAPWLVSTNRNMVNENPIAIGFIFRQPLRKDLFFLDLIFIK